MADLTFLEKFTKGDTAKMKRYISMYLAAAPETFAKMHKNIADGDWEQLRINAHSLKPQADYMGIPSLKAVLLDIENNAASGDKDKLTTLYENAHSIHSKSEGILQDFVNTH